MSLGKQSLSIDFGDYARGSAGGGHGFDMLLSDEGFEAQAQYYLLQVPMSGMLDGGIQDCDAGCGPERDLCSFGQYDCADPEAAYLGCYRWGCTRAQNAESNPAERAKLRRMTLGRRLPTRMPADEKEAFHNS